MRISSGTRASEPTAFTAWLISKPAFGIADHERDIRRDRAGRGFAGVRVHAGWKIDGGDARTGMLAQPLHFRREIEKWIAQSTLGTDAEQAVEQQQRPLEIVPWRRPVQRTFRCRIAATFRG